MRKLWLGVLGTLVACAPHLEPIEPISTDRPDQTESTQLVPAGMVQVEGGATMLSTRGARTTSYGEMLVRAGVHDAIELRAEPFTYTSVRGSGAPEAGGVEDLALGVKVPLFRRDSASRVVPNISVIGATSVPTGARDFRADGAQPEAVLAADWSLAERLSFGSNLTMRRGHSDGARYWERGASTTFGFALGERTGMYAEWFAVRDTRDPAAVHVLNSGVTYKLSSDFQLDARIGRGNRDSGTFGGIGFARRW
ncbi:MAG TPA: transporter [Gemmatimonadaceae bacterium]|nr:transporter [Gemmatimonadaceae bacterium]